MVMGLSSAFLRRSELDAEAIGGDEDGGWAGAEARS